MKIWRKAIIADNYDKKINLIATSLTNYIYKYGPISDITLKYKIKEEDIKELNQYTTNRIAGLLLLYLAKDVDRINDIVNKYNNYELQNVMAEIEGYVEK